MGRILVSIKSAIRRLFVKKKKETWKDIEYFNEQWTERIQKMSEFISSTESVMDLGCGKMWLRSFLSSSNKYYPVDYTQRDDDTIIIDFNKNQFPNLKVDTVFASGILEYINDPQWFIEKISKCSNKCIISYCTVDYFPEEEKRVSRKWVNNLKFSDIVSIFKTNKMELTNNLLSENNNSIFVFEKL